AALIAPDDVTLDYLRRHAPAVRGDEAALAAFRALRSDAGARYESERAITLELQAPQMTWGVNPAQVV
ncbi:aconitase family protein, partial [Bordetella pertussis]|uniref:aconitase family protein n=2 Tax=Bordetella TaxID=517 RepID=UPI00387A476E